MIHSYEPNPAILSNLRHHAEAVGGVVYPEAVQSKGGFVSLSVDENDSFVTQSQFAESSDICAIAFSDVVGRAGGRIDLLKMDCEGAEWDILEDTESWKHVYRVVCEYHGSSSNVHTKIIERLQYLGFTILCHEILPEHPNPELRYLGQVQGWRKR